jgi:ATP-dependent DNA helicase PIF1
MDLHAKQPITLSREFDDILNLLEYTNEHYFITGRAGTGKSTLLQLFRTVSKKKLAILAPTGIAALNVKGQTLHSFFGFPPRMMDRSEIFKRKDFKMFKNIDVIIIDEISMVRADMLDNINLFLQINRENSQPFGGIQMVYFGDLFQLPPVVASEFERKYFREKYESQYFFSAHVFKHEYVMKMIELMQIYRQDEKHFIRLLDNIRQCTFDEDDLMDLNMRYTPVQEDEKFLIHLCARNATAEAINKAELAKLDGVSYVYEAKLTGEFQTAVFPTEPHLLLKIGAQIMFVKNDVQKQFVNGTIGRIVHIDSEGIMAEVLGEQENVKLIKVEMQTWENVKYKYNNNEESFQTETVGTFTQYPIKLAWAITIHKSQGKTFERAIIDLGGGAFESGQTYVALSRCRKLAGVYLKQLLRPRDIIVDPKIVEYYDFMKRWS